MLLFFKSGIAIVLYVCNKLWYGIESISSSHSASSHLSGELMQLHSIHTLANLALKETVPPQSRTSPHVTVKNICSIQRLQGKRKLLKNPECQKYIEYSEKFQGKLCFSGKRRVVQKSSMVRNILNTVKILRENCFWRQAQVAQKSWTVKIFSIQYIECIFTWGDPCNLG